MLIHVAYHKTGYTWLQQHAFTEARGFTRRFGRLRPVFERLPTRRLEGRLDAGRRRQIATHVGDSYAEGNRPTVALTGLPLANLGYPPAGSI